MKLYDFSVAEFVALLERAKGHVYMLVQDGTAFSLTSKIAQLYAIKILLEGSSEGTASPQLKFQDPQDKEMFLTYLTQRFETANGRVH